MRTLTPSGRWLSINVDTAGFFGPWAYISWVHSDRASFRVHTCSLGSAEMAVSGSGRSNKTIVREASLKGNRLVSLEDTEQGGTTLAWQGDFHELSTYVHGTGVAMESFVGRLLLLDLRDSRDGLVFRGATGTGTTVDHTVSTNFVREIGSITVRSAEAVDSRPGREGRHVRGGQLWRDDLKDAQGRVTRTILTIINDSTLTAVAAFDPAEPRLRAFAASVDVRLE